MALFIATGVAHSGEVGRHKEWGEKKEKSVPEMLCLSLKGLIGPHVQFGKRVILMMGK